MRALFDGVVVRIDREIDLLAIAPGLAQFAGRTGLAVLGAIKLTDASIARCRDDDVDTARLTAEALLAARLSTRVRYVFDTFMDVDRGYFRGTALSDRMFNNPRPALRAYAAMAHLLGSDNTVTVEPAVREGAARRVRFCVGGAPHILVSGVDRAAAGALAREARWSGARSLHRRVHAARGRKRGGKARRPGVDEYREFRPDRSLRQVARLPENLQCPF
ncbi:MAG: hypothetical protein IPO58_24475 [Betaproteobacteria bacterium]|nr:hypothetical protein [Betaproteobacteria bacterium]